MVAILYKQEMIWPKEGPLGIEAPPISGQIQISPTVARRRANRYLTLEVAMEFQPGDPVLLWGATPLWQVPIHLHLPSIDLLAPIGTLEIDATTGAVLPLSLSQIHIMRSRAHDLVTRLTPTATPTS